VVVGSGRVESKECFSNLLAGKAEEREFAAGMVVGPFRDVVYLAVNGDPCVTMFVVFLEFLQ